MNKTLSRIFILSLLFISFIHLSCSSDSMEPLIPDAGSAAYYSDRLPGTETYEIVEEHWVTDFEFPEKSDAELLFWQWAYYAGVEHNGVTVNKIYKDPFNADNTIWQMTWIMDATFTELIWNPFSSPAEDMPEDLTEFGNAIAFKARSVPILNGTNFDTATLVLQPQDSNGLFSDIFIPLSPEWKEYVAMFKDFRPTWGEGKTDFTKIIYMLWFPKFHAYAKYKIHVDDIRIVRYVKKR